MAAWKIKANNCFASRAYLAVLQGQPNICDCVNSFVYKMTDPPISGIIR